MSSLYQRRRKRPEMNLVPLIDVLVMLIFFAFVTMQFKSAATLNITLPKVETAGKNEFRGNVTISIDKDGSLTLNAKAITDAELPAALAAQARVTGRIVQLPVHDALEIERYLAAVREAGLRAEDIEIRTERDGHGPWQRPGGR
ncbi:MAG: biopolymer transporter ExbD [Opitutales bacterium]|nr:biopolymer transporter ExbD [Opitutales bacterium]